MKIISNTTTIDITITDIYSKISNIRLLICCCFSIALIIKYIRLVHKPNNTTVFIASSISYI